MNLYDLIVVCDDLGATSEVRLGAYEPRPRPAAASHWVKTMRPEHNHGSAEPRNGEYHFI